MRFDFLTIFPEIISAYVSESLFKRAREKRLLKFGIYNLRDYTNDKHRKVDDRPYGGGPGMVFKAEPVIRAVKDVLKKNKNTKSRVILFSPTGKLFDNRKAAELAKKNNQLVFICDRYEGMDVRVPKILKDMKIKFDVFSIGPYVLTGAELPALVVMDAVSRHLTGVLGKEESREEKRFGAGMPTYTRPEEIRIGKKTYKVPKILLSGHHKKIGEWRKKKTDNR